MHNSLLLSSCFCQVASSKLRKEKGHRSIHAVTLGIPCVVMGCVMTATKPWCAIDCYRTLKTIGHYLASITTQLFKCETLANVSKETVPVWFSKEGADLFSTLMWDSSHSHNKPQKSCTLNWFSGSSSARKPLHWQNLSIWNIYC